MFEDVSYENLKISDVGFDLELGKAQVSHRKQNNFKHMDGYAQTMQIDGENIIVLENQAITSAVQTKFLRCFNIIDKLIDHYINVYGESSTEIGEFINRLTQELNSIALRFMNSHKNNEAQKLLKKCEIWTRKKYKKILDPRVSTLNHLACCMRKIGNPKNAIKYLESAYKITKDFNASSVTIGSTCLNLSSVYSQINKHEKSIKFAKEASLELSHAIISMAHEFFESKKHRQVEYNRRINMLAIADFNIATESEFFGQQSEALKSYQKAYLVLEKSGNQDSDQYHRIKKQYFAYKKKTLGNYDSESGSSTPISESMISNEKTDPFASATYYNELKAKKVNLKSKDIKVDKYNAHSLPTLSQNSDSVSRMTYTPNLIKKDEKSDQNTKKNKFIIKKNNYFVSKDNPYDNNNPSNAENSNKNKITTKNLTEIEKYEDQEILSWNTSDSEKSIDLEEQWSNTKKYGNLKSRQKIHSNMNNFISNMQGYIKDKNYQSTVERIEEEDREEEFQTMQKEQERQNLVNLEINNIEELQKIIEVRKKKMAVTSLSLIYTSFLKNKEKNYKLGKRLQKKQLIKIPMKDDKVTEIDVKTVKFPEKLDSHLKYAQDKNILLQTKKRNLLSVVCVYPRNGFETLVFRVRCEKNPWREEKLVCNTPILANISSKFTQKMKAFELTNFLISNMVYSDNYDLLWKDKSYIETLFLNEFNELIDGEAKNTLEIITSDNDTLTDPSSAIEMIKRKNQNTMNQILQQKELELKQKIDQEKKKKDDEIYFKEMQKIAKEFLIVKKATLIQRSYRMYRSVKHMIKKQQKDYSVFVMYKWVKINTGKKLSNINYLTLEPPNEKTYKSYLKTKTRYKKPVRIEFVRKSIVMVYMTKFKTLNYNIITETVPYPPHKISMDYDELKTIRNFDEKTKRAKVISRKCIYQMKFDHFGVLVYDNRLPSIDALRGLRLIQRTIKNLKNLVRYRRILKGKSRNFVYLKKLQFNDYPRKFLFIIKQNDEETYIVECYSYVKLFEFEQLEISETDVSKIRNTNNPKELVKFDFVNRKMLIGAEILPEMVSSTEVFNKNTDPDLFNFDKNKALHKPILREEESIDSKNIEVIKKKLLQELNNDAIDIKHLWNQCLISNKNKDNVPMMNVVSSIKQKFASLDRKELYKLVKVLDKNNNGTIVLKDFEEFFEKKNNDETFSFKNNLSNDVTKNKLLGQNDSYSGLYPPKKTQERNGTSEPIKKGNEIEVIKNLVRDCLEKEGMKLNDFWNLCMSKNKLLQGLPCQDMKASLENIIDELTKIDSAKLIKDIDQSQNGTISSKEFKKYWNIEDSQKEANKFRPKLEDSEIKVSKVKPNLEDLQEKIPEKFKEDLKTKPINNYSDAKFDDFSDNFDDFDIMDNDDQNKDDESFQKDDNDSDALLEL